MNIENKSKTEINVRGVYKCNHCTWGRRQYVTKKEDGRRVYRYSCGSKLIIEREGINFNHSWVINCEEASE